MVGEVYENVDGHEYIVIGREGKSKAGNIKWRIRFTRTGYETVVEKVQMKRGKIKDRYEPVVFDVGYVGDIDVVSHKKEYNVWHKMLGRCYNPDDKSYINYGAKGVYVVARWHSFENFVNDIPKIDGYDEELYKSGVLQLDKDMKQADILTKVYSRQTCTFLTKEQNSSIINRENRKLAFIALSPEGQVYKETGIGAFCREHNLTRQAVSACLNGRAKSHMGWTFKYEEEENE